MRKLRTLMMLLAAILAAGGALPGRAGSLPSTHPTDLDFVMLADTDCHAVGESIADREGGRLARAAPSTRGGRTVCIIVVLVPPENGKPPRRAEFVVPAN
jgi:hypothetical protein